MYKVKLKEVFDSVGGIIRCPKHGFLYRMNGGILELNMRRDESEEGWVRCASNDFSYKYVFNLGGVTNGLMPVREFQKNFGFTPKWKYIVNEN